MAQSGFVSMSAVRKECRLSDNRAERTVSLIERASHSLTFPYVR